MLVRICEGCDGLSKINRDTFRSRAKKIWGFVFKSRVSRSTIFIEYNYDRLMISSTDLTAKDFVINSPQFLAAIS